MERKLARIVEITEITPIDGADSIECAVVENGWKVVVQKGQYKPGDIAVYCEVDSWIPHYLAPFLSKGQEPREYNGVVGERLRTVKLRGQISQGLLLPSKILDEYGLWPLAGNPIGHNMTRQLGIQKYEPPIPAHLSGDLVGGFPTFIPKTDQERCQNLYDEIFQVHYDETYEVSIKLDGTSCTIYYRDGDVGVCGRNWNLKESPNNTLWKCANDLGLIDKLKYYKSNVAIQGEVIGEGINKNNEKIPKQAFFVFDIYDIDTGKYLNHHQRMHMMKGLFEDTSYLTHHVPILEVSKVLSNNNFSTIEDLLLYADGPSLNKNFKREGVVFKSLDSDFTFKAISNKWLLKNDG
jgi:RNA ligase (TIGR02306 family)